MIKIYTKTGDRGKTSLFDGTRVSKTNIRVETYGTIDELNSIIGVCVAFLPSKKEFTIIHNHLLLIQSDLFEIGSSLANPSTPQNLRLTTQLQSNILKSEQLIDKLTAQLPQLSNFILPGGTQCASFMHLARTVCRRAERRVVELSNQQRINNEILVYLNRLSDLFHVTSRFINYTENQKDVIWKSKTG